MKTDIVIQTLKGLLDKLCISYTDVVVEEMPGIRAVRLSIKTPDSGMLIGTKGETIAALNHLLKRIALMNGEITEEMMREYVVDVNDYQIKHIDELQRKARLASDRARSFEYNVEMEPMNAYDRLIVHNTLQDLPNIKTESAGEGQFRHVVVKFSKEKENEESFTL
ncbi:MAG: R3H domain-containing nucleic acid-binding protein [Candidatus Paceibacterota bacterium]